MDAEITRHLRHNLIVNILDGAFFGLALGFASFVTVIPLFVSTMTDSAVLIGLIPAIHSVGWQLPQLLTADRVARLSRYRPMVVVMTLNERVPFLGLAAVAWLLAVIGPTWGLVLTFLLLTWQGLGGGFTATAWQSLIGKVIPATRRGTFFGVQAAAANLLASGSAVVAGFWLERLDSPLDFTLCFLAAAAAMGLSWLCLAWTRELAVAPAGPATDRRTFWRSLPGILQRDANFRWFLVARLLSQVAMIALAFYTVYAVRYHSMSQGMAGIMTSVLLATQVLVNPLLGWLGDHWSHRAALAIGSLAAAISPLLALIAPDRLWFYPVFILAGVAAVAFWTISMAMVLEFGTPGERPAYIGLANTLIAPVTFIAPLAGGWLADTAGYPTVFILSAVAGVATTVVFLTLVRDPRHTRPLPA